MGQLIAHKTDPVGLAGATVVLGSRGIAKVDNLSLGDRPLDVSSIFAGRATLVVDQDETIPALTLAGINDLGVITTDTGVGRVTITVSTWFFMGAKYGAAGSSGSIQ